MTSPRLSLSHLSALETPPHALVTLAAEAGYWAVGLRLNPAAPGAIHYPLRRGGTDLAETRCRMQDTGVAIYDVEFIPLTPDIAVETYLPMLEAAAELGARRLNVSGDDPDVSRLAATFAHLCEIAAGFNLAVDLEFMRWRHVGNIQQAHEVVRRAGAANGAILLDALHLIRSGGQPQDLATLAPGLIRSVQLSDAPLAAPPEEGIIEEARNRRLAPGLGELPLLALLRALSDDIDLAVEVPLPADRKDNPLAHLKHVRQATDALMYKGLTKVT